MRIGIYALCKNEEKHVFDWAESTDGADVVVVTDTGSTDSTPQRLRAAGVTVATGYVCPWRWDDAHTLSLNHLPPDVDVAVRLDLDERLQPGWREAIERAWTGDCNNLHYRYVWSWTDDGRPDLVFNCDRVHARAGFRWASPTHEGLVCWNGEKRVKFAEGLEIHHHRDAGKKHRTDLELLRVAVRESPHDARAYWYLAREMEWAEDSQAAATFAHYLGMKGGSQTERAYAYRALYRLTGEELHLHRAAKEAIGEPDAWERLAFVHYQRQEWREVYGFARQALEAPWPGTHATDPKAKARAADLASVAAWNLGARPEALRLGRLAVEHCPGDKRLRANVEAMERIAEAAA
jgi:hypothetical protein